MEKWMCLGSIIVAALMMLLFLLDAITGHPFSNGVSIGDSPLAVVDVAGILAAGFLGYLGWNELADHRVDWQADFPADKAAAHRP